MSKPVRYKQTIQPLWSIVRQVRDKVEAILAPAGEEISYACKMVASELVENAVKYGITGDGQGVNGIEFELSMVDREIVITVKNRVASEDHLKNARNHIDVINASGDPQQLYVERLKVLVEEPGGRGASQLGLYRIAYEGGFDLAYVVAGDVLTVIATRAMRGA